LSYHRIVIIHDTFYFKQLAKIHSENWHNLNVNICTLLCHNIFVLLFTAMANLVRVLNGGKSFMKTCTSLQSCARLMSRKSSSHLAARPVAFLHRSAEEPQQQQQHLYAPVLILEPVTASPYFSNYPELDYVDVIMQSQQSDFDIDLSKKED